LLAKDVKQFDERKRLSSGNKKWGTPVYILLVVRCIAAAKAAGTDYELK
jgi:hypothetical protein